MSPIQHKIRKAIPPAYAAFIGRAVMQQLRKVAA